MFKEWGAIFPALISRPYAIRDALNGSMSAHQPIRIILPSRSLDAFNPSDERPVALIRAQYGRLGHPGDCTSLPGARHPQTRSRPPTRLSEIWFFPTPAAMPGCWTPTTSAWTRSCTAPYPHLVRGDHFYLHSEPPYALIRKILNVKATSRKDSPHAGQ